MVALLVSAAAPNTPREMTWINNVRAVLPDGVETGLSIGIAPGKIAKITTEPGAHGIDGAGHLLMPGFVDMHGDMIEREVEPRPHVRMPMELGLRDLDRRLSSSGVTTAYASVSFNPKSAYGHLRSHAHSMAMLRSLKAMRPTLGVDHRVHARFEVNDPDALGVGDTLIAEGTVDLGSLTDHTPGQGQYRDLERMAERHQSEGHSRDGAEAAIAERIREKQESAGDVLATLRRISQVCATAGIPLASHDDDTPEKVALMADLGAVISEFPVTLTAARAAHDMGLMTAMGAPNALRGESYSGNLSARDAHAAGVLDILAADYHPSAILPAVLHFARNSAGGLPRAVDLAAANPARALGFTDRGSLAIGQRADLILADDTGVGRVRATFAAGDVVFSDGVLA